MKKPEAQQQELEWVSIESLVPEQHLLRKVDHAVDFSFIRDRVNHLYSEDNGRPALDPVVLFKLLLLGYLYGVRSERQLMREAEVNVAYRWFLGLRLRDKVPDASTLSQNRRRSYADAKQLHGHRYARMRGLTRAQQQCLLATSAQNIKKIALLLSRTGPNMPSLLLQALISAYTAQLHRYQQLAANANLVN